MKIKRTRIITFIIFVAISISFYFLNQNIPLRTAIFRYFSPGNWYITSEKDTLYSLGYYGIRKYLTSDKNSEIKLLAQNNSFCHNTFIGRLIGRSGTIYKNNIYVASRSYLAGDIKVKSEKYLNGEILILRKTDLSIVNKYKSDIKLIDIKTHKNMLIISGLKGFDIYDISIPDTLKPIFKYRQDKFTEFQGFTVFNIDTCSYIAFTRFSEGLSIWDISNPHNIRLAKNITLQDSLADGTKLPKGLQCFNIISKYPYLYATIAPMSTHFNKENDRRGIITYDISDINHITQSVTLIPKKTWYKKKIGDPEPSYIDLYDNKIYTNFGEKGVAVFDITHPNRAKFERTIDIANNNFIQPIHINKKGTLFAGAFYHPEIYSYKIKKEN